MNSVALVAKQTMLALILLVTSCLYAQPKRISALYTDFDGGWSSAEGAGINPIVTNRSHNLLSFTYDNINYSTGANDPLLVTNGVTAVSGSFRAMPVITFAGNGSTATYILLPGADDGNANGFNTPLPSATPRGVLTDGINGLNIGTALTNLPTSAIITYNVQAIDINAISDAKPDVIVTQVAQPVTARDVLYLVNSSSQIVGDSIKIDWNTSLTPAIGRHSCDLFNLTPGPTNSATISSGAEFAQLKDFRMVGYKLSDFNITSGNAASVARLVFRPAGGIDVAFVAYNADAFTSVVLPVIFSSVNAVIKNGQALVTWQTVSEINSDRFVVEKSDDGQSFQPIGSLKAAGTSNDIINYNFTDFRLDKKSAYYRVKEFDFDGKFQVSKAVRVSVETQDAGLAIQAYQSSNVMIVKHPQASSRSQVQLFTMSGGLAARQPSPEGDKETRISLNTLVPGVYQVVWTDGDKRAFSQVLVR